MKNSIKVERAKKNITQAQLADQVGVRRETIVFLEKGKYNPSLKMAYLISRVLDEKIEEIFIFEEKDLELED